MFINHTHTALVRECLKKAIDLELPPAVTLRLQWIEDFAVHGSVSGTCRRFGIARTTFYRWLHRFSPENLLSLQDEPRNLFSNSHCSELHTGKVPAVSVAVSGQLRAAIRICMPMIFMTSVLINLVMFFGFLAVARWEASRADLFDQSSQHLAPPSSFNSGPLP